MDRPSISIPYLLTKRSNFFRFLAGQSGLSHFRVCAPLGLVATLTAPSQAGQCSGRVYLPIAFVTPITLGIILLDLITSISVFPFSPIPRRSISLMLTREARETVVPSSCTGSKMAIGVITVAPQDHSTSRRVVSATSSCHLKARPARVAWWPVTLPVAAYSVSS